jgi:hypothetical protein
MMKPADLRILNDPALIGQLDLPGFRAILVQSKVAAAIMIIRKRGPKRRAKRFLVDHDDVSSGGASVPGGEYGAARVYAAARGTY